MAEKQAAPNGHSGTANGAQEAMKETSPIESKGDNNTAFDLSARQCSWGTYFGDTAAAYLIYLASGKRFFRHIEDIEGYRVPQFKRLSDIKRAEQKTEKEEEPPVKQDTEATSPLGRKSTTVRQTFGVDADREADEENELAGRMRGPLKSISLAQTRSGQQSRTRSGHWTQTGEDFFIVDWYSDDDLANPQNWTMPMKYLFLGVLAFLTFTVYMGASVISPGLPYAIEDFGISQVVADLLIAFYVLGYGVGPLFFSPLSEIPAIGRLPMYVAPLSLFFAVGFAPLFSPTLGGLLVGRLLTGFLASPALATGGASVGDVLSPLNLPYGLCVWVVSAYQGPGLGPVIVGYVAQGKGTWRWCLGIYQIFVVVCVVSTFFLMPETSGPNILARRAARIRKLTGDNRYRSMGEIHQAGLTVGAIIKEAIIKPFEITIKDPSIAYVNLYVSLIYAFYYLFFAGFPIIFFELYGFGIGNGELPYLAIAVGGTLFCAFYVLVYKYYVVPRILDGRISEPEQGLDPALPFSIVASVSLFCVGWTAGRTHWMAPIVFTTIFAGANFFILQPVFAWIAMVPAYQASLFAANDFFRSCTAFGLLIAGSPMFKAMGIGPGYSFLGGMLAIMVPPLFYLRYRGKNLRLKSKFAQKA